MSYNYYRKCAKCDVSRIYNSNLKYHRFPKLAEDKGNLNQLKLWAAFCFPGQEFSEEDLGKFSTKNKVLCERHFNDMCYTGTDRKRLIKYAVPTLNQIDKVESGAQVEHGSKPKERERTPELVELENYSKSDLQKTERTPTPEFLETESYSKPDSQITEITPPPEFLETESSKSDSQKHVSLLNHLSISKVSQLSLRELILYRRCRYLSKTVLNLRKKLKAIKQQRNQCVCIKRVE